MSIFFGRNATCANKVHSLYHSFLSDKFLTVTFGCLKCTGPRSHIWVLSWTVLLCSVFLYINSLAVMKCFPLPLHKRHQCLQTIFLNFISLILQNLSHLCNLHPSFLCFPSSLFSLLVPQPSSQSMSFWRIHPLLLFIGSFFVWTLTVRGRTRRNTWYCNQFIF